MHATPSIHESPPLHMYKTICYGIQYHGIGHFRLINGSIAIPPWKTISPAAKAAAQNISCQLEKVAANNEVQLKATAAAFSLLSDMGSHFPDGWTDREKYNDDLTRGVPMCWNNQNASA